MLFELLTGDVPFAGWTFDDLARHHVSEPAPSVSARRPGVPPRVAAAVARALEKEPGRRFPSMSAFVAELEACLDAPAEAGEATEILAPPAPAAGGGGRGGRRRRLGLVLVTLLVCLAGAVAALRLPTRSRTVPLIGPRPAIAAAVHLQAVATYDPPPGDGVENDRRLPLATDGDPHTSWTTEWYATARFAGLKRGVGLVLDAGKPLRLGSLTVQTDTPGFTAVIEAGAAKGGPFRPVSSQTTISPATTIALRVQAPSRYYLLWITGLSPATGPRYVARVDEVTGA